MGNIDSVRKAIGWLILAFLLSNTLINLAAAIGPFWSELKFGEQAAANDTDLVNLARKVAVWTSLLYLKAVWELARIESRSSASGIFLMVVASVAFAWPLLQHYFPAAAPHEGLGLLMATARYGVLLFCLWKVWRLLK